MLRQNGIGIEFIEMEGRIADGNAYRFGHSSSSFKMLFCGTNALADGLIQCIGAGIDLVVDQL